MNQLPMFFLAGMLLAGTAVKAQTADEIIKKHNEAIGGIETWKKVSSMKYIGSMIEGGSETGVVVSILDGRGVRQDITIGGMANYVINTPTEGWLFFPVQGQTKPEPLTADEVKESVDDLY